MDGLCRGPRCDVLDLLLLLRQRHAKHPWICCARCAAALASGEELCRRRSDAALWSAVLCRPHRLTSRPSAAGDMPSDMAPEARRPGAAVEPMLQLDFASWCGAAAPVVPLCHGPATQSALGIPPEVNGAYLQPPPCLAGTLDPTPGAADLRWHNPDRQHATRSSPLPPQRSSKSHVDSTFVNNTRSPIPPLCVSIPETPSLFPLMHGDDPAGPVFAHTRPTASVGPHRTHRTHPRTMDDHAEAGGTPEPPPPPAASSSSAGADAAGPEACRRLLVDTKLEELRRYQPIVIIKDTATVDECLRVGGCGGGSARGVPGCTGCGSRGGLVLVW